MSNIEAALAQFGQDLNINGFKDPPSRWQIAHGEATYPDSSMKEWLSESACFDRCVDLLGTMDKLKGINTRYGSYGLKHVFERYLYLFVPNGYVANGTFILAALASGFKHERINGLNALFNISQKSIDSIIPPHTSAWYTPASHKTLCRKQAEFIDRLNAYSLRTGMPLRKDWLSQVAA
jgi:hypothetical protein